MKKTYEERMKEMTWEEYEVFEEEITKALHEEEVEEEGRKTKAVAEKYSIEYNTICWYDFYGEDE